jgi:hypothetical protein
MLMTPREGAEQKVTAAGRSAGLLRDFLSRNTRKELDSFACRLYGHAATSPRQRNEIRDLRCTGVWRSLVARKFWVLQVAGSNPAAPTIPRDREKDEAMSARIYRPMKSATQSGAARTKYWLFEYAPEKPREVEPLMGWTSSSDMKSQVRLSFATKEEAIAYAERNGIAYRLEEPPPIERRIMQYADNFKPNRAQQWTH